MVSQSHTHRSATLFLDILSLMQQVKNSSSFMVKVPSVSRDSNRLSTPFQFWVRLHAPNAVLSTSSRQLIGDLCLAREGDIPRQA